MQAAPGQAADPALLAAPSSQAGSKNKFRTSGSKANEEEYQPGRLERVAAAATKQSLRVHALQLAPPTPLTALLPMVREAAVSLVAVGGAQPVLEVLQQARAEPGYKRWAAACTTWMLVARHACIITRQLCRKGLSQVDTMLWLLGSRVGQCNLQLLAWLDSSMSMTV